MIARREAQRGAAHLYARRIAADIVKLAASLRRPRRF